MRECESCDGSGVRVDVVNGLRVEGNNRPGPFEIVIERCDECQKFPDDLKAAESIVRAARWVESTDGMSFVYGDFTTRKPKFKNKDRVFFRGESEDDFMIYQTILGRESVWYILLNPYVEELFKSRRGPVPVAEKNLERAIETVDGYLIPESEVTEQAIEGQDPDLLP